jgi:hypothetical protein
MEAIMFWYGLIIGLFVGTILGVFLVSMCFMAKDYNADGIVGLRK